MGSQRGLEEGALFAKFVLEDDAAEDDGDGSCQLADEAEGRSREGYVVAFDV